jgi:hypothetical protein
MRPMRGPGRERERATEMLPEQAFNTFKGLDYGGDIPGMFLNHILEQKENNTRAIMFPAAPCRRLSDAV